MSEVADAAPGRPENEIEKRRTEALHTPNVGRIAAPAVMGACLDQTSRYDRQRYDALNLALVHPQGEDPIKTAQQFYDFLSGKSSLPPYPVLGSSAA